MTLTGSIQMFWLLDVSPLYRRHVQIMAYTQVVSDLGIGCNFHWILPFPSSLTIGMSKSGAEKIGPGALPLFGSS